IGHVKRCLALAGALSERGAAAVLVTRPTEAGIVSLVKDAGVPFRVLPEGMSLTHEAAALNALGLASLASAKPPAKPGPAALVLDVSHREILREAGAIAAYFAALAARFHPLIVIDSLFEECLVGRFDLPVDLAVIPYAGAEEQDIASPGARLALGPAYFPLEAAYGPHVGKARRIRAEASRVLVTAGGGDAGGFSEKTLQALQTIDDRRLEVRVVIGPAFQAQTRRAVARLAAASRHRVRLLDAPADLAEPMAWCDLAVATTGLTKYALAATATPALLMSHYTGQAVLHRPFERLDTARYLGATAEVSVPVLAAALRELLDDKDARRAMAAAGAAVVDGRGIERTLDLMLEVAAAEPPRRLRRA
ncbi:MAG: hypothetical protein ACE5JZ_12550, partial [Kiloniellales bacterium]